MSSVFGHGRLRLYLLKLLEESPRHGYEVIRLLRDRFLGLYSPSPGTIYPRLAKLEEEGLVTYEIEGGRKVYRLTRAGRSELAARQDELGELEVELSDSVRDIAKEVKEDVRQTVRSLRDELTQAARDVRRGTRSPSDAWVDEKDRWKREWRRVWESIGGERHQAEEELDRMLTEFVEDVQRSAAAGRLDETALDDCRAILEETIERLGAVLRKIRR